MAQGYTILQNAVKQTFIWRNSAYKEFWVEIMMLIRPTTNIVESRGVEIVLPPHTLLVSVSNTGLQLTEQRTRTFLAKLVKKGYISLNTEARRTYITLLDTDLYKYPKPRKSETKNTEENKQYKDAELEHIMSKLEE